MPSLRTVAACEIEAFAIANLVAKMEAGLMDPAPIWPNLKTFPWECFRQKVDLLSGGYPCQPFSSAGQRKGKDDPRHLWPWIADGIGIVRPTVCFFENVEGHVSLGLSAVISDLEELGYKVAWGIFSASEVGAPHQRKRVFILAHRNDEGLEGWVGSILRECTGELFVGKSGACWPSRPGERQYGWEPPRVVADSHRVDRSAQAEGREHDRQAGSASEELGDAMLSRSSSKRSSGWEQGGPWKPSIERQTQPPLGGDADGAAGGLDYAQLYVSTDNRTDELRLLGNGVVPIQAALAFTTLYRELKQ